MEISCLKCKAKCDKEHTIIYKNGEPDRYYCYPCSTTDKWKIFARDKILTSSLMLDATLACHKYEGKYFHKEPTEEQLFVNDCIQKINTQIKNFEEEVWFGSDMQHEVLAPSCRGLSATHGDLKVLTYVCAGRCMITMYHKDDEYVSLLTEDNIDSDRRCMGLQGLGGSFEIVGSLINQAIELRKQGKLKFKEDREIRIF